MVRIYFKGLDTTVSYFHGSTEEWIYLVNYHCVTQKKEIYVCDPYASPKFYHPKALVIHSTNTSRRFLGIRLNNVYVFVNDYNYLKGKNIRSGRESLDPILSRRVRDSKVIIRLAEVADLCDLLNSDKLEISSKRNISSYRLYR